MKIVSKHLHDEWILRVIIICLCDEYFWCHFKEIDNLSILFYSLFLIELPNMVISTLNLLEMKRLDQQILVIWILCVKVEYFCQYFTEIINFRVRKVQFYRFFLNNIVQNGDIILKIVSTEAAWSADPDDSHIMFLSWILQVLLLQFLNPFKKVQFKTFFSIKLPKMVISFWKERPLKRLDQLIPMITTSCF